VPGPATTFRRARSADHKEQRARDLLEAARMLAAEQGVRTVTLTAIATRAGVHVSAVRRYFDSREDILLTLAGEGWREWAGRVAASVQPGPSGPVGPAETLAATLTELPLFCDLLAHVPLTLEREAPVESVRAFTVIVLAAVESIAGGLADVEDGLDRSRARELVGATALLAGSLWQAAQPTREVAELFRDDPRLAPAAVEFRPQLTRLVRALALGLPLQHRGPTLSDADPARG
jgi:AcrR family transcriptional regulator